MITGDEEKERQIGNREEVHGSDKCTSILYMEKDENGIVNVARSTKCCVYEPLHPISGSDSDGNPHGGLKSYPIVNMIWEKVPNSARGISEVKQLIPNQLELNKTLARRSMSVKMTAFPRIAYDATAIQDPEAVEIPAGPSAKGFAKMPPKLSEDMGAIISNRERPISKLSPSDDKVLLRQRLVAGDLNYTPQVTKIQKTGFVHLTWKYSRMSIIIKLIG